MAIYFSDGAQSTKKTVNIYRVHHANLSGTTNYDVTVPANTYQVDVSFRGIRPSGSGNPVFLVGNSSGIKNSGYYYVQSRHGGTNQGVYESNVARIYVAGWQLGNNSQIGDGHACFRRTGSETTNTWAFHSVESSVGYYEAQTNVGYFDISNLTTVRMSAWGTGWSQGNITYTCYSTT